MRTEMEMEMEMESRRTVVAVAPVLAIAHAYLAGSTTPEARRPGTSHALSIQKNAASTRREKTSLGRPFASMSLHARTSGHSVSKWWERDGICWWAYEP